MTRRIGDVSITRVVELEATGGSRFILPQATPEAVREIAWLQPHFADERGRLRIAVQSLLVETPTKRIIIDTGLGNHKTGRIIPHWNGRTEPFLDHLAAAGFPADTIDIVLNTHLHVDHVGWNTTLVDGKWRPTFEKARYVMGRTEFDYWRDQTGDAEHRAVFEDSVRPIHEAGLVDLVAPGDQVCPELSLVSTPGHSIGHLSVLVRSGGEEAMLGGDVLHHPCQMAHPEWSSTADYDQAESAQTRRALFERLASSEMLFIGAHFTGAGWGRIRRDGEGYRLEVA